MLKEAYIQFIEVIRKEATKELGLRENMDPLHIKIDVQLGIMDRSKEQDLKAFMKKLEEAMTTGATIAHNSKVSS